MEQAKSYKKTLKSATGMTMVVFILTFIILGDFDDAVNANDASKDIAMIVSIALAAGTIRLWIQGTKQYIDHRFQETEKQEG